MSLVNTTMVGVTVVSATVLSVAGNVIGLFHWLVTLVYVLVVNVSCLDRCGWCQCDW